MILRIAYSLSLLLFAASASAADIVSLAEATELRSSTGAIIRRVEKDESGNVIRLVLKEMTLTAEQMADLGKLSHLRRLDLYQSNFGDAGMSHLKRCSKLESLVLTKTEITDSSLEALLELKQLKYLCLGSVRVSPTAAKQLSDQAHARGQDLRMGYSQRK